MAGKSKINEELKQNKKELQDIAALNREVLDLNNQTEQSLEKQAALLKEFKNFEEERETLTLRDLDNYADRTKYREIELKLTNEQLEKITNISIKLEEVVAFEKEHLENAKKSGEYSAEELKLLERELALAKENIKEERKKAVLLKQQQKQQEKMVLQRKKHEAEVKRTTEELAGWFGVTSDASQSTLGRLENIFSSTEGISVTLGNWVKSFRESFNLTSVLSSVLDKVAESTIMAAYQLDNMTADMNKLTGATGNYAAMVDQVRFGSLEAGVGIEKSGASIQALYENMSAFTDLNPRAQEELARTVAIMDSAGVAAQTTAKNMDMLTKAFGMGVDEAISAQKEIMSVATSLGVSPQKLADDFNASLPSLAQYGSEAVSIFKDLAAQSKQTGVEINTLIGITKQFDTFEGAAQAAGKLNAVLGGGLLNSVELLNATEAERIQLLRDSVSASGRSFESMSKYEKMAVASAAGINDLAEASRIFGQTDDELGRLQAAQDAEAKSLAQLTQMAQASTSAQEKFKLIIEGLSGAALPLLDAISKILNFGLKLNDMFGGVLGPALALAAGGFWLLTTAVSFWTAASTKASIALVKQAATWTATTSVKIYDTIATQANAVATNISTAAKSLNISATLRQTAAIAGFIVEETLAGVATLSSAAAAGVKTLAMWALSAAEWAAATATTAFTIALAILASPITLVVLGVMALIAAVSALIYYFDDINGWIQDVTNGFFDFWDILTILAGPIGIFIYGIRQVVEHWDQIVDGFTSAIQKGKELWSVLSSLLSPLNLLIKPINMLGSMFSKFTGMNVPTIPEFAGGVTNFGGGIALVGEDGPELVNLPGGSNVITNENTQSLAEAGRASTNASISTQTEAIRANKQLAESVSKASSTPSTASKASDKDTTVIMQVDGRELGRFVLSALNKNMKLHLADS